MAYSVYEKGKGKNRWKRVYHGLNKKGATWTTKRLKQIERKHPEGNKYKMKNMKRKKQHSIWW